ncbi:HesA/MoeB/ThiF family protein [Pseudahrensia aquimaris]|uniref:HesA/MoeB/ThiF family protein n=1 Tax=Pseudahrensia aquimaris TaxID=744461 RepID=A0ABW3FE73_9HYPH
MSDSKLTLEEIDRYARHLVLPEIGGAGQQKLKKATVLVVGAGGLGSPVLLYLAAAGVGTIRVVDDDMVSLSNMQRQVVHSTQSIGRSKVNSAKAALREVNPYVKVETVASRLTKENARETVTDCTVAVDGTDNFATRYILAEACEKMHVPLVTGAVNRFDGSVTVLMPWQQDKDGRYQPRYVELFPNQPEDDMLPTCEEAGVLGATTGIIGTIQAAEVIKIITGAGEPLIGRLLMVDTLRMDFQTITYRGSRGGEAS